MALKNLFDMVKADKYTADGREALIKAQEAETEDKVYQIGEISQKTGLQKTANGWVKPKNGKQPGAKKPDESARIAASKEARAKKSQELGQKAAGDFAKYKDLPPVQRKDALGAASHEGISIGMTQRSMEGMGWDLIQADDKVNVYGKPDGSKAIMKHDGKKITEVSYEGPGSKTAAKEPGPDRDDSPERAAYERELSRQQAQRAADDPRGFGYEEPPMEPAAPRREAVSAGRMMKDLDGNFWSRPEDFKEDITSRGWDVDEMTNEYAVISNEAGSQYEVRFDDHSDDGDLTVRNFKALQIDEDDDDDSLEDSAPSLSEIVDRVYNIGEISEKTGLQKTAQGWKPPKETKFGKVKQNKEGQWGVQTKQGKGSDFLKHKSEKEASRALANYTAGYNTTERSKQDPHSDYARQQKQWNKEVDRMRKNSNAERRAEHASHFQENKPDAADRRDQIGGEIKGNLEAAKYYFDKAQSFYPTDPSYKTYMTKAKQYNDEAKAQADDNGFDFEEMHNSGITQAVNKYAEEQSKPAGKLPKGVTKVRPISPQDKLDYGKSHYLDPNSEETKQADEIVNKWFESEGKEIMPDLYLVNENGEARAFSTRAGLVNKLAYMIKNDKPYDLTYISRKDATAKDAAPHVLTGDCRIRIRKEKPALTGDTKIRVRK